MKKRKEEKDWRKMLKTEWQLEKMFVNQLD